MWLLFPILSFGCLSAAGFLYVGLRARRPSWWIPGVVYTVLGNACFWVSSATTTEGTSSSTANTVSVALLVFLIWPASILHAAIINVSWLKWRAGYQPWYAQPQQTAWVGQPMAATPPPLPPQLQNVVPPQQQFYAAPQPYQAPPQPSYAAPQPYQAPPPPSYAAPQPPVDVNTATEQQLTTLPGITPDRAARIVEVRRSRGGFVSPNDFAAAAGLAPHEFVAVRDRLVCSPPVPPDDPAPGPYGRIVDV
ncbi:ComEA family DNA-binding protein [Actinoplanes palleronii]|uniref:Helix-hairpin-helix protein n=1 Tax=Actinoplanes palleronii TaxID=113570 RepID=A0ABQ4BT36_9ACTN|nr:helix-hairpin-helix domain-containing protein [Actinoplanes palleronii]GIE73831.1 hypothetical protein Apa02nite_099390 [Actinoplanes palleronii]